MEVEYIDISSLVLDPENEREHPADNLKDIKNSLKHFGQQTPITVKRDDNVILKGNGTVIAAKELGWDKIWVKWNEFTEKKAKAYKIADNRSAEKAKWNKDLLSKSLDALKDEFSLESLGFDDSWIKVDPVAGLTDDDSVPEQVETRCKLGDLWILGEHRLVCGDSTDVLQVDRLMGGDKADMVFTDPPYGIDYKGGSKKREEIANDNIPVLQFYRDFLVLAKSVSKSGASIYIWHASTETHNCINAAIDSGWQYKQYIIWKKNNSTFGRQDYHWQHEPCFYGWGKDGSHTWHGDRKQTTVWDIDRPSKSEDHPTMKPVELCERGILNSSKSDDIIYEPFCGSGSTLVACEKNHRKCYGMELNPHYCDVIITRWENFTGKTANLETRGDAGNG